MSRDNDYSERPSRAEKLHRRFAEEARLAAVPTVGRGHSVLPGDSRWRGAGEPCDWDEVDWGRVQRLCRAVTQSGDALFLANGGDGGIFAPVIYHGKQRLKCQERHAYDVNAWLDEWIKYYEA